MAVVGPAYIGSQAPKLGRMPTATSTSGPPALLERLWEQPLTKEPIATLKEHRHMDEEEDDDSEKPTAHNGEIS